MSTTRVVARNVMWNWTGMAVNVLAGFVVAPFLVHRLGQTGYGLWILVASLLGYLGLLDLGVRAAVGRQIAFYRATGDREAFNATLNTALVILSIAGAAALALTFAAESLFFHIFDVPPDQAAEVSAALRLIGVTLLLWLPLSIFDAMLWAQQRFDLINAIDITSVLIRAALTFVLIARGHGLVALATLSLLTLAGGQAIKAAVVFHLDRALRLGPRHVRRGAARELLSIGFWNTLMSANDVLNAQVGSLIIGARLGVWLVTPFNVAARLMGYGRDFVIAGTGVLTPVAIALHVEQDSRRERTLLLEGGKYCLALAIFFLVLFVVLGRAIIELWMGPELRWAAGLLLVLVIGEALPLSQWIAYSVIFGKYRYRELAIVGMIENALAAALALALVGRWGVWGVAFAFALPAALCRGVFRLVYACLLVRMPLKTYFAQVLLPVVLAAAPPAAGLLILTHWHMPHGWRELSLYVCLYGVAHVLAVTYALGYWRATLARRVVTALHSVR